MNVMRSAAEPIERYELLGELATGGMATVYLGRQRGPFGFTRTVAIKSMHPQYAKDEDFRAMFLDEATLTARIRHPNVVPTLDIVCADTKVLLVMEYVDGVSLSHLQRMIRKQGANMSPQVSVAIMCDVLHGLHAAHELADDDGAPLHVVHRDVSPQNIHVGVDGLARVLDFGIAKAATRRYVTQGSEVKGKLAYMSVEQLRGGEVDRRTDLYAAAVVLWECLTGRHLFDQSNEGALIQAVLAGAVEPPSMLADVELPPALDRVVMRGLSTAASERFSTAQEMAAELAAALSPAPRTEVAALVRELAGAELESRAHRLRGRTPSTHQLEDEQQALLTVLMEHATITSTSRSVAPPLASSSPRASRGVMIVLGAVGLALATGGAFFMGSRTARPTRTDTTVSSAEVAELSSPPPLPPPPPPNPEPSATHESPTATGTPAPPPKKPVKRPPKVPKKNCNPPFVVDAHGDRHYKPECVE